MMGIQHVLAVMLADDVLDFVGERLTLAVRSTEGIIALICTAAVFFGTVVLTTVWVNRRAEQKKRRDESTQAPEPAEAVDPLEAELQDLRLRHGVRPLSRLEETFGLDRLPDGVYGFSLFPSRSDSPVLKTKEPELFEVHKTAGGEIMVVGFVPSQALLKIASASEQFSLALYSRPKDDACQPVTIPMRHVTGCRPAAASGEESILELEITPLYQKAS